MVNSKLKYNLTILFVGVVFSIVVASVHYLNYRYDIKNIAIVGNWIILFTLPIYYYLFYFLEKVALKKIENKNIVEELNIEYYRNIIDNYSPAMLSVIYDGRLDFNKDLMLSVLYLKTKGYISIEEDSIVQIKEDNNISDDLKIILSSLNFFMKDNLSYTDNYGRVKDTDAGKFHKNWPKSVFKKIVDSGLAIERKEKKSPNLLSIILFIEGIVMLMIDEQLISFFAFALSLSLTTYILKYLTFAYNQYPKTQSGYELYIKLRGLKKFMRDYSKLNERQLSELELWDDYMLYTIMFNKNTRLNKEFKKLFQDLKYKINNIHTIKS